MANEGVSVVLTRGKKGMLLALSCRDPNFRRKNETFIAPAPIASPNSHGKTARRSKDEVNATADQKGTTVKEHPR